MKRILQGLIFVSLLAIIAGCAMTMEYGRWPDPGQLAKLRLGQSDSTEVLQLLGEPTGRGVGRMPDFTDRATVWSYEYQRISGAAVSETEINLLFVFLWHDLYVGHFWFEVDDQMKISGLTP